MNDKVVVTFFTESEEEAKELAEELKSCLLNERSPGDRRWAPWIPGAVLRSINGVEVSHDSA